MYPQLVIDGKSNPKEWPAIIYWPRKYPKKFKDRINPKIRVQDGKKYMDVGDTTLKGWISNLSFGVRVLMDDFFPAVEPAKKAGITHFEFGVGARFQSLYFYLREDAFEMMDRLGR